MTLITTHPFIALILVSLVVALITLVVGGLLRNTGTHDMPTMIEPHDFDDESNCAWCQKEQAIAAQPHESHGICQRHKDEMLADAERISKLRAA